MQNFDGTTRQERNQEHIDHKEPEVVLEYAALDLTFAVHSL